MDYCNTDLCNAGQDTYGAADEAANRAEDQAADLCYAGDAAKVPSAVLLCTLQNLPRNWNLKKIEKITNLSFILLILFICECTANLLMI